MYYVLCAKAVYTVYTHRECLDSIVPGQKTRAENMITVS